MTISSSQYTITSTRSQIVANDLAAEQVLIHVGSGAVFIGGADVTTDNGYRLDSGDQIVLDNHTNPIHAVATSGNHVVYVLVIQK